MSDSQFEDLGASTIMNEKLILEVRKKEQMIKELTDQMCVLQRQLIAMQSCQHASQQQLQKKNIILKQMVSDNIRLTKRLTNQEEQIIKLKEELLATDRSIHETLSTSLVEKESLLKLNQELSQGLLEVQRILDEKVQELKVSRLKMSEKDKFVQNYETKIKELETEKSHLQNLIKSLQQSQPMHLKAVSDMQQRLNSEKKKSQSLFKEIDELNKKIMELQQNHLQATTKLNTQLALERQTADKMRKEKDSLIDELIDLKQTGTQLQRERRELRVIIESQKSEITELQSKARQLTQQVNNLSIKELKYKESQPQAHPFPTAKDSQSTIKQLQTKCRKLQHQLDQCGQVLNYSYQQCESLREELREMRIDKDRLAQECVTLNEDKNKIRDQLQSMKLENSQLLLTNHQLAVLIEQSSEQLAITRKQLTYQQQLYAKKAIQDLNDQSSHEFVLLKIKEIVHNIETQINACQDLKYQEKAHAIYKQKQALLKSIKSVFETSEGQKMMRKDGNIIDKIKRKQWQQAQKAQRFFDQLNPFRN